MLYASSRGAGTESMVSTNPSHFLFFFRWLDYAGPIRASRGQNFFKHLWRIWSSTNRGSALSLHEVSWEFGFFIFFTVLRRVRIYGINSRAFPSLRRLCLGYAGFNKAPSWQDRSQSSKAPSEKLGHWMCIPTLASSVKTAAGIILLIIWCCVWGRDSGERFLQISLLALMMSLVSYSFGVQSLSVSFWNSHKWDISMNFCWIGMFIGEEVQCFDLLSCWCYYH